MPFGITIIPKGNPENWNYQSFTNAYKEARKVFNHSICRLNWPDLEQTVGNYNLKNLEHLLHFAMDENFTSSLIIEVIHTVDIAPLPQGVEFKGSFDESRFMNAYLNLIKKIFADFKGKFQYFWVGNEVDFYLQQKPDQVKGFKNLLQHVTKTIHEIDPDTTVGVICAYHIALKNDNISLLKKLADHVDILALTLYMQENDIHDPYQTKSYMQKLLNRFENTRFAIIESSWSTKA